MHSKIIPADMYMKSLYGQGGKEREVSLPLSTASQDAFCPCMYLQGLLECVCSEKGGLLCGSYILASKMPISFVAWSTHLKSVPALPNFNWEQHDWEQHV